jgi:3'(2'), 5'-bisphosphate nucleotidase
VTRADREANALICDALGRAFPDDGIVAEESVPSADELLRHVQRPRVWFVDPLDGTREFTEHIAEFAVMIGLAEQGRATFGVVGLPMTGELLIGRVGEGAFLEDAAGVRRPLEVSRVSDPQAATLMTSRSHPPAIVAPFVERLGVGKQVRCGSVGVKVARLATGVADLYVHGGSGPKLWDTCAPEAILVGAGGRFTELSGAPIQYARATLVQSGGILATNAALYDLALAVTRSV